MDQKLDQTLTKNGPTIYKNVTNGPLCWLPVSEHHCPLKNSDNSDNLWKWEWLTPRPPWHNNVLNFENTLQEWNLPLHPQNQLLLFPAGHQWDRGEEWEEGEEVITITAETEQEEEGGISGEEGILPCPSICALKRVYEDGYFNENGELEDLTLYVEVFTLLPR